MPSLHFTWHAFAHTNVVDFLTTLCTACLQMFLTPNLSVTPSSTPLLKKGQGCWFLPRTARHVAVACHLILLTYYPPYFRAWVTASATSHRACYRASSFRSGLQTLPQQKASFIPISLDHRACFYAFSFSLEHTIVAVLHEVDICKVTAVAVSLVWSAPDPCSRFLIADRFAACAYTRHKVHKTLHTNIFCLRHCWWCRQSYVCGSTTKLCVMITDIVLEHNFVGVTFTLVSIRCCQHNACRVTDQSSHQNVRTRRQSHGSHNVTGRTCP